MGYFSNLELDIESMSQDGYSPAQIAEMLQVSIKEVVECLERFEDEDFDYEPDVDELTEWMDFDPDC
jgi:transposase